MADVKKPLSPAKRAELLAKREMFCQLYARSGDCFGNGTRSYMKAYSVGENVAAASASRLLSNVKVTQRINELLDVTLSDAVVDAQLATVIMQHVNLPAKVAAIREFNRVKKRVNDGEVSGRIQLAWE